MCVRASNKQDHETGQWWGMMGGQQGWKEGGRDGWPILIWTPPQAVVRPIWVGVPTTLCQPTTPLHLIAIAVGNLPFRFSATFGPRGHRCRCRLFKQRDVGASSSRYIAGYNSSHRFFHVDSCFLPWLRCRRHTLRSGLPIFLVPDTHYYLASIEDRNWFGCSSWIYIHVKMQLTRGINSSLLYEFWKFFK